MKRTILLIAFAISVTAIAIGQSMSSPNHGFFQTQDMKWMDGPASLPKGSKVALLEGNPTREGPFTIRLQLPDVLTRLVLSLRDGVTAKSITILYRPLPFVTISGHRLNACEI